MSQFTRPVTLVYGLSLLFEKVAYYNALKNLYRELHVNMYLFHFRE